MREQSIAPSLLENRIMKEEGPRNRLKQFSTRCSCRSSYVIQYGFKTSVSSLAREYTFLAEVELKQQ